MRCGAPPPRPHSGHVMPERPFTSWCHFPQLQRQGWPGQDLDAGPTTRPPWGDLNGQVTPWKVGPQRASPGARASHGNDPLGRQPFGLLFVTPSGVAYKARGSGRTTGVQRSILYRAQELEEASWLVVSPTTAFRNTGALLEVKGMLSAWRRGGGSGGPQMGFLLSFSSSQDGCHTRGPSDSHTHNHHL